MYIYFNNWGDVKIGANCVVLKDVPDNSICYDNLCKIIRK